MLIQADITLLTLLKSTGPVARIVLGILAIASIWSWGIILSKSLMLRKVSGDSAEFWKIFHQGQNPAQISKACASLRFTPLVPVLDAAIAVRAASAATLQRAMQRAAAAQLTLLESHLTFLATTASVAPFIGLFGTVWGVLTSFKGLGNPESATLQAVAPGIAEALIATAFGLFAAIPAVVAYNQFVYRINSLGGQIDDLQAEMLAIAERNGL